MDSKKKQKDSLRQISQAVHKIVDDAKDNDFKKKCLQIVDVCLALSYAHKKVDYSINF